MNFLALATSVNRKGRKDGNYFCAEMRRGVAYWKKRFDDEDDQITADKLRRHPPRQRRHDMLAAIEEAHKGEVPEEGTLNAIAVFGHGTWRALLAGGFNRLNVYDLASAISHTTDAITIILYCCSCGAGRGKYKAPDITLPPVDVAEVPMGAGFAMRLAGALVEYGVAPDIYAHLNRGKAAKNPFVVNIFEDSDGQIVRREVVPFVSWRRRKKDPEGRRAWQAWRKLLSDDPFFRYQFPFMSYHAITVRIDDKLNEMDGAE
jgi:hypothetical protein